MPKASKEAAPDSTSGPGFEARYAALEGGYTVGFETFTEDADMTPLLKGLPDDRCPTPHWGYVLKGKITYIGEREEPFEAGEAFYVSGGHTLTADAGTEVVFFSPTVEWQHTLAMVQRNREGATLIA